MQFLQCSSWNSYFDSLWPFIDITSGFVLAIVLCVFCFFVFLLLPNWKKTTPLPVPKVIFGLTKNKSFCLLSVLWGFLFLFFLFFTWNFSFEMFKTKWYYESLSAFCLWFIEGIFLCCCIMILLLSMTSFCFLGQNFTAFFFESQHYFPMEQEPVFPVLEV